MVTTKLIVKEPSHNQTTFDSTQIKENYKGYICLIDNAKSMYVHHRTNVCIVFASLKLEESRKMTDSKIDVARYWMPVWSHKELEHFLSLQPGAFGKKGNIHSLVHLFGGTIGNMTHKNKQERIEILASKCEKVTECETLTPLSIICNSSENVKPQYSSLIEIEVCDHQ